MIVVLTLKQFNKNLLSTFYDKLLLLGRGLSEYYVAWWNVENLYDVMPWTDRARKVKNFSKDLKTNLKD